MNRRRFLGAVLGTALLVGATIPATATAKGPQRAERIPIPSGKLATKVKPGLFGDKTSTVLIELTGKPVALRQADARASGRTLSRAQRATFRSQIKATQDALRGRISATGAKVVSQFQDAINGIKVRATGKEIAAISKLAGVAAIRPLGVYKIENVRGVPYVGALAAWQATGKTGTGVKIGVIDTGIDYYHANFGGSGDPDDYANDDSTIIELGTFPTAKVVGGWDFSGNDYDASGDVGPTTPTPDADPLDCNGHGSHTSGTAAGEGVLEDGSTYTGPYNSTTISGHDFNIGPGVAPQASLYAYKVFGCDGSTDLVVDAINRAVADGVDVINMSLGSPFGRADTADAIATDNAVMSGVVVATSAGNEGPNAYMTGSPGTAQGAISSAALDAVPSFPGATVALDSGNLTAIDANGPSADLPVTGTLHVLLDSPTEIALGCDDADYSTVAAGEIVVTIRGTCARTDRAVKGQAAGAAAVIMVNNANGLPPWEAHIPGVTIPFIGTDGTSGGPTPDPTTEDELIAADGDTVTITSAGILTNPAYKSLATFSSGGPRSGDSALKPDVTAPGVSLVSTHVGGGTDGEALSGTSMASPHTAGAAALVIQAHPTWTPSHVKAALMNTATIVSTGNGIKSYDPRTAGAGVINVRQAIDTVAYAYTGWADSSISFGYDPRATSYSETRTFTLRNDSGGGIKYNLAGVFVGSSRGATLTVSPASPVLVAAHSSKTITVRIALTAAKMAALPDADTTPVQLVVHIRGYIRATPVTPAAHRYTLHVPFLAVPRSLSAVTATGPTAYVEAGGVASSTIKVTNPGNHHGWADFYAWGFSDGYDGLAETDIRAAGVQSLPGEFGGLAEDDRLLGFVVNTWGRWSNACDNEIDVLIDTGGDSDPEFAVIGVDFGAIALGDFSGEMAAFVVDLGSGDVVDIWNVLAPTNGSTVTLYAAASDFGLAEGADPFNYSFETFSVLGFAGDETAGTASIDPWSPAVTQGDLVSLAHGASVTVPVEVDLGAFETNPTLGWLITTNDDANGASQATGIPVGTLPTP